MTVYMDMGTSNTRLWLAEGERELAVLRGSFGAGLTSSEGRAALTDALGSLLRELYEKGGVKESDVSVIVASGMASSELGIAEVPHRPAPAGREELAAHLHAVRLPEITSVPFLVVPGVKKLDADGRIADMMRGEETETVGICDLAGLEGEALLVLPGTHNKAILVKNGRIVDFATSMSGELMSIVSTHSILRGNVSYDFALDEEKMDEGMVWAMREGVGSALFHVRVMSKNGESVDAMSSFFFGAVFSQDVMTVRSLGANVPIYVGGRAGLRRPLCRLLGGRCREIPEEIGARAVRRGLEVIGVR